ncbi:4Fe-4S dicluster domain-containing protein, partial [Trichloromonas sp.]|uniref:4Fe-4S dicluster domain-containing protein n=1 Tax=Trichloromonas sp. TaxID=3069249 RepID=UPI003D81B277
MKFSRRTFLAGLTAATAATLIPRGRSLAASPDAPIATLIDLTRCDGCSDQAQPRCVTACREKNQNRFPEPDPTLLKDYWPKDYHEDWSNQREVNWRLTPYNWLFVEEVYLEKNGREQRLSIPRRCMHCVDPPCVKLCPFGTAKQERNGVVHIDPALCFGGAKCRAVCPWHVPQRQTGVGPYTALDPLPIGAGVMYKCDLCRDRLADGRTPACQDACPRGAMQIGPRAQIVQQAEALARTYQGHLYGLKEHGGTSTLYVSKITFEQIDRALTEDVGDASSVMRFHQPDNQGSRHGDLAKAALLAPLAGIAGA